MEHGVVNDKVPMMAKNIQGIFSVEAKKKKEVSNATVAKDRKKVSRSQSVPPRTPKNKEKPKKKVKHFHTSTDPQAIQIWE